MRAEKEGDKETQSGTKIPDTSKHTFPITWASWGPLPVPQWLLTHTQMALQKSHSRRQPNASWNGHPGNSRSACVLHAKQQENQTHISILGFSSFQINFTKQEKNNKRKTRKKVLPRKGYGITHTQLLTEFISERWDGSWREGLWLFTLHLFIESSRGISSFYSLCKFCTRNDLHPGSCGSVDWSIIP